MQLLQIIIHQAKTHAILRFHPWIFSGAIKKLPKDIANDILVEVVDENDDFLAVGYYTNGNIAIRILSFSPIDSLRKLFLEKLQNAFLVRKDIGLADNPQSNVYRLIHAEGDGLPGLIADFYNGVIVLQAHSVFIAHQLPLIAESLREIYGEKLTTVYNKSFNTLPKNMTEKIYDGFLLGDTEQITVMEQGCTFEVNFITGQKTGFFIDQRENRGLLATYAKGKNVLNTFSYSGGFSVYAAKAGATKVVSVDVSEKAIALAQNNMQLNGFEDRHEAITSDIFEYLKTVSATDFDVMVLDPPAFAKNVSARHQAIKAYTRLNLEAMQKIKKGGILFTFSCSQVVTADLFKGAVTAAAIHAKREVRILHQLSQAADHPVSAFHPEGNYLKGLVLHIN